MTKNFKIEADGFEFAFHTMNAVTLQLYRVYVMVNQVRRRFHMQRNEADDFYVTDKEACPQQFLHLEKIFSEAIRQNGRSE